MRVEVDCDQCDGTGFCVQIAPRLFALGDDGVARVLQDEVPVELEDAAVEAEAACPTAAIRTR